MSQLFHLLLKNRSYRRFDESHQVTPIELLELVSLARMTPSAANLQPLKYYLSWEPPLNETIFRSLKWAGYLKEWNGPEPGERPSAYIIITADKDISIPDCDHGICAQTILLGAVEKGLGGCIIAAIARNKLQRELELPENLQILLVLAIGKPVEQVKIEEISGEKVEYWRDEEQVHHVPKRSLEEIVINYPEELPVVFNTAQS